MECVKVLELFVAVVTLLSAVPLAAADLRNRKTQVNEGAFFSFSNIRTDTAAGCPGNSVVTLQQDSQAFQIDFGTEWVARTRDESTRDAKQCVLSADVYTRNNTQFRIIEAQYGGAVDVPDDADSFASAAYKHFFAGIGGGLVKWEFSPNTTKLYAKEQEVGPISWSTCGGTDEFRVHLEIVAQKAAASMRDVMVNLDYAAVNPGLGNCRYEVEFRDCEDPPQTCVGNTLNADSELGIDSAICNGNGKYRFGLNRDGNSGLWRHQDRIWPRSGKYPQGNRLKLQRLDARIVLFGDDGQGTVFESNCHDNGSKPNKCEEMYINRRGDIKILLEGNDTGWKLNNQGEDEYCFL